MIDIGKNELTLSVIDAFLSSFLYLLLHYFFPGVSVRKVNPTITQITETEEVKKKK